MKKFFTIFVVFAMMILLASCGTTSEKEGDDKMLRMELLEKHQVPVGNTGCTTYRIFRDPVTDVLYLESDGFTVMLNADGKPLTYTQYIELYEAKD